MSKITKGKVPWKVAPAKRIGLLDADGILYAAALKGVTACDGEQLQVLDDEFIYRDALERAEAWADWLRDCDKVFLVLSARTCFRKRLLPSYKANRKGGDRPVTLDALRTRVAEEGLGSFKVILIDDLEADDVCGIMAGSFQGQGYETVIVSPDKDLLQIPGMVLTPKPGSQEVVFSEVTQERGDEWHIYQALVGDVADNYKGCPGIGDGRAEVLVECVRGLSPEDRWDVILATFAEKGLTEEDALVQFRVARILRDTDWDAEKKEPILWNPK
jgi:DNA polymerase-1